MKISELGEYVSYFKMSSDKFDELVNDEYNRPHRGFEFVADHEANNYSNYTFSEENEPTICEYDQKKLDKFKKGEYVRNMTATLIQDLRIKGKLPKCEILIKVYW